MLAQTKPIPSHGEQQGKIGVSDPSGGPRDLTAVGMLAQTRPIPRRATLAEAVVWMTVHLVTLRF